MWKGTIPRPHAALLPGAQAAGRFATGGRRQLEILSACPPPLCPRKARSREKGGGWWRRKHVSNYKCEEKTNKLRMSLVLFHFGVLGGKNHLCLIGDSGRSPLCFSFSLGDHEAIFMRIDISRSGLKKSKKSKYNRKRTRRQRASV